MSLREGGIPRMRVLLLVSIALSACSAQQASQQPEMSIQPVKAPAEASPKKEDGCFPSPTLLALTQCLTR